MADNKTSRLKMKRSIFAKNPLFDLLIEIFNRCNLKIFPYPVLIKSTRRFISLILLEVFLFSDFSLPLAQSYALVPALRTNTLGRQAGRGGAITVEGRGLTEEQHIAVNQAVLQDFASGEAGELTEEDLRDLDPDGIAERNNVTVYEIPGLKEFDKILIAHPGRGGETYSHSLKQVYLSPKRVKFIKSLSAEAKKQFWEHEVLGHLVKFGRGASEEDIQAKYPINLVRNAAQIAALQQQTAPQREQLKQLLIYIAQKNLTDFIKLYKLHKAKQLDKDGYQILLKYTNGALGQNWVPGPSVRDREEVFEEVNQLLTSGQITASAKPDIGGLPTAKLYTEGIEGEFEQLVKRVPVQISGDIAYEELMNAGFQPHYKIVANGVAYYVSEPYTPSHGRASFVYYFYRKNPKTDKEEIFTRSVYRSNSQNVLRVASHRRPERRWIGKGLGQATTTLPLELQSTFEKIYQTALSKGKLEEKEAFYEILRAKDSHMPADSFMKSMIAYERGEEAEQKDEKEPEEQILIGKFNAHDRDQIEFVKGEMIFPKGIPETFGFTPGFEPDFENGVVETFETDNPVYGGKVTSYRIISKNKEAQYLFNVDMKGRVWIGDVQGTHSEITRFGIRKNTIYIPSDFLTPANEYESEIPEGYKGEWQHSDYWDASAYIDKLPVVQEFRDKVLNKLSPAPILTKSPEAAPVEDETANIIQQEIIFFDGRTREFKLLLIALLYSQGSRETVRELILSQGNVVDNQYIMGIIFTKTNIKNKEELISAVNQYATSEPNIERHIEDAVNIAKTYNKDYSDTAQNVLFKLATYRAHTELKKPKAVEEDRPASQFLERILSRVRNNENVTISFVCTANKNRSAIAHIMLKNRLQQLGKSNVRVQSAGIATRLVGLEGEPLSLELEQLLIGRGVDADIINDFRSQQVTADFVKNSDIIVVASDEHRQALINAIPEAASKIVLFTELHTDLGKFGDAFPDPEAREISRVALVNLIENTIVASFIGQVEGHTPAAVLKEPVKKIKTLSVEKGETELEVLFVGDVWITAGLFTYRIWVENYTVNFQRYDSKEGWPLGNVRNFALGYEFRIGGERGYKNDYRLHGDPKLAPSHFLVKVTRGEKDDTYKLSVKDLNSLNGTTVEWNESLTPREAAPEEEMPVSPTETPHQRFVRMYSEAGEDAVKRGRLQKLILAVGLWWDADTNARDNGIKEDNKAKALEVLNKRGNQHLLALRSSLEAVINSRYPYSAFWEQADRTLFMKVLELAFESPEQQNRKNDYIPLIDELFPSVLEAKAGRGVELTAPPQALPRAVPRVYTDLDSLERDISALEVGLQSTDIVKLPRIGFHGEEAGHEPVGEIWYFLLDANLEDYWRQQWRADRIEATFKLSAAKKAGNKIEVLAEMFMPLSEFFERLQGTIIFTSSYGKLSSSDGVLPEIYLLVEVPESNFQLRDKSAEKEGSKVSAYDPKVGMKDYRLLFAEGSTDSQNVPKEAVLTKIGLTKEEFTAIAQWASRDGSRTLGMSFFVNRLLYKKTLETLISLGRIQPASAPKALNNQQTRFVRAMVMLLRALGAVDGDVNRVKVNLTRLAERALSGEVNIAPILQEDANIFLDAWREYEKAGGDVSKIRQTSFNKVLEVLGNSAAEIAESLETSGAIAALENLARQSGESAAFHLTEHKEPLEDSHLLKEHELGEGEGAMLVDNMTKAEEVLAYYGAKGMHTKVTITVEGEETTILVANNIKETGITKEDIQTMINRQVNTLRQKGYSKEQIQQALSDLLIVAADKLPNAALGGDCVGNKLVLLSKGLSKINDKARFIMADATLYHEISKHELTGQGKEAHTEENDTEDVEYIIKLAGQEKIAIMDELRPVLSGTPLFGMLQKKLHAEVEKAVVATAAQTPIFDKISQTRVQAILEAINTDHEGMPIIREQGLNDVNQHEWKYFHSRSGRFNIYASKELAVEPIVRELEEFVVNLGKLFEIDVANLEEVKIVITPFDYLDDRGAYYNHGTKTIIIPFKEMQRFLREEVTHWFTWSMVGKAQPPFVMLTEGIALWAAYEADPANTVNYHMTIPVLWSAYNDLGKRLELTSVPEAYEPLAQMGAHLFHRIYVLHGINKVLELWNAAARADESMTLQELFVQVGLDYNTVENDWRESIPIAQAPAVAEAVAETTQAPAAEAQTPAAAEALADALVKGETLTPEEIALAMPAVADRLHASVSANTTLKGYAMQSRQMPEDGLAETAVIDLSTDTLKNTADLRFSITNLPAKVKKVRIVVHDSNLPEGVELDGYLKEVLGLSDEILGGRRLEIVVDRETGVLNTAEAIGRVAGRTGEEKDVMRIVISDVLEDTEGVKGQLGVTGDVVVVLRQTNQAFFLSWLFEQGLRPGINIYTSEAASTIIGTQFDLGVFEVYRQQI